MNTWKLNLKDFKEFIIKYTKDFNYILKGIDGIQIEELVETYNIDSKEIILCTDGILERLKSGKGVFFLLGIVADEDVNYFRFLDHIQYRIGDGEFYEHSGENFHLYKCNENKLNLGEIKPWVEMSLGIMVELVCDEVLIRIGEIKESSIIAISNIGDFKELFDKWLKSNSLK